MAESAAREAEAAANDDAPPVSYGHPIFGRAKVATVLLAKIRYRAGNDRSPPIRVGLGPIDPAALLDSSQLFPLHGAGRYDLRAIDGNGLMACPPIQVDVPDENGEILPYLVAPMSGQSAAVGTVNGGPVGDPSQPPRPDPMAEAWKEIARNAETGRTNDINAFLKVIEKERETKPTGEANMFVAFLQGRVTSLEGVVTARDATIDRLRDENTKLREDKARIKGGEGDSALVERFGGMLFDKLGGGGNAGAPAPSGEMIAIPTAAELKVLLDAGKVPQEIIRHAVKLWRAGGLPDDRWAVIEPIAAMAGML